MENGILVTGFYGLIGGLAALLVTFAVIRTFDRLHTKHLVRKEQRAMKNHLRSYMEREGKTGRCRLPHF